MIHSWIYLPRLTIDYEDVHSSQTHVATELLQGLSDCVYLRMYGSIIVSKTVV